MKKKPKVSIIIRTRNEEEWLRHTLLSVQKQTYTDYEIVIVDNDSNDLTLKICKFFKIKKIIKLKHYLPGKSINRGVKIASGNIIVLLSAHCVPTNKSWLKNLIKPFDNSNIVAVYGRQSPTSTSNNTDIRDLFITFGLDQKLQSKDPFFHNANSAIRRATLDQIPFDERLTNIEDRDWGKKIIKKGYKIFYEPQANVYHYHGIHHSNSEERVLSTVNVLKKIENINLNNFIPKSKKFENLNFVITIICPNNFHSQKHINPIKKSIKFFEDIFDNQVIILFKSRNLLLKNNKFKTFNYPLNNYDLVDKLKFAYNKIKDLNIFPDFIIYVNPDYLIRDKKIFLNIIKQSLRYNFDSTILALNDYSSNISIDNDQVRANGASLISREKKKPILKSLFGFGSIVKPKMYNRGILIENNSLGIVSTNNLAFSLRYSDKETITLLKKNKFL